jgi:hypothetical protein
LDKDAQQSCCFGEIDVILPEIDDAPNDIDSGIAEALYRSFASKSQLMTKKPNSPAKTRESSARITEYGVTNFNKFLQRCLWHNQPPLTPIHST